MQARKTKPTAEACLSKLLAGTVGRHPIPLHAAVQYSLLFSLLCPARNSAHGPAFLPNPWLLTCQRAVHLASTASFFPGCHLSNRKQVSRLVMYVLY